MSDNLANFVVQAYKLPIVNKSKILIAAIVMALAVAIGAFGAHGLKPHLDAYGLEIYKTANFYHFIHGLGLFLALAFSRYYPHKSLNLIFFSFVLGIILFSGSLYILALRTMFPGIPGWFGAITPLGGLCFIVAWILMGIGFKQVLSKESEF